MKSVWLIALTTFRELIREKLFIIIVFISCLFILLSLALGNLSIFEYQRILADLGLGTMELSTLGLALFSGSYILNKEFEKQTCLILLAKPLSRAQFLLGKFIGLSFLMILNLSILTVVLNFLFLNLEYFGNSLLIAINILMKCEVILALVLFLSVAIRPIISLLFGLSFYLYGHWINNAEFFLKQMKDQNLNQYYKILELISPQFFRMNWKSFYYMKDPVPTAEFSFMIGYFMIWISLFMVLAILKFRKKDIV